MIKKMYALFKNGKLSCIQTNIFEKVYYNKRDCELEKSAFKNFYKNHKIKTVWVFDRDPFENVRKVMKELSSDCVTLFYAKRAGRNTICNLFKALEKDLKNTEGAG